MNTRYFFAKAQRLLFLVALLVSLGPNLTPLPTAHAQFACTISQVTDTSGNHNAEPAINADGSRIVLSSRNDLTGGNADGNTEIFLFDSVAGFSQITDSSGGGIGNFSPSINADGTRIAFRSSANLVPPNNADGNQEIFLYDAVAGISQISVSTGGLNQEPSINADGTRIAFTSDCDLTGGNADGNNEIFLYDAATGISQITDTTGGRSLNPSISGSGTRIAFMSDRDLTGGNADGNREVFLFDTVTGFSQVTSTVAPAASELPWMSGDGTRITFFSSADGNSEVYLFDATTGLSQLTTTTGGYNIQPTISADGTRIAFDSNRDLTGGNADGNDEIFLYDEASGFFQVTSSTGGQNDTNAINADGTRIAFESNLDLAGSNADGNQEIFLAVCAPSPPSPPRSRSRSKEESEAEPIAISLTGTDFVIKRVDREVAQVGDVLTYTINWTNPKDKRLTQVVVEDTFDDRLDDVRVVSASKGSASASGNTVRVDGFELEPGEQVRLVVRATISDRAQPGDVLANFATLSSPDASVHRSNTVETTIIGVLPETGSEPVRDRAAWLLPVLIGIGASWVLLALRARLTDKRQIEV